LLIPEEVSKRREQVASYFFHVAFSAFF